MLMSANGHYWMESPRTSTPGRHVGYTGPILLESSIPYTANCALCMETIFSHESREICAIQRPCKFETFGKTPVEFCHSDCLRCGFCRDRIVSNEDHITTKTPRCWISGFLVACQICRQKITHCAKCTQPLEYNTLVRNLGPARFHLDCLTCEICGRVLVEGDHCRVTSLHESDRLGIVCAEHVALGRTILTHMDILDRQITDETDERRYSSIPDRPRTSSFGSSDSGLSVSAGTTSMGEADMYNSNFVENSIRDSLHTEPKLTNTETKQNTDKPSDHLSFQQDSPTSSHNISVDSVELRTTEKLHSEQPCLDGLAVNLNSSDEEDEAKRYVTTNRGLTRAAQRKPRVSFHPIQLSILRAYFIRDPHPSSIQLNNVAELIQLDRKQVQIWFQNARSRTSRARKQASHSSVSLIA